MSTPSAVDDAFAAFEPEEDRIHVAETTATPRRAVASSTRVRLGEARRDDDGEPAFHAVAEQRQRRRGFFAGAQHVGGAGIAEP